MATSSPLARQADKGNDVTGAHCYTHKCSWGGGGGGESTQQNNGNVAECKLKDLSLQMSLSVAQ